MEPKVIYVAGPYTAKDDWVRKQNIYKAEQINAWLWAEGYYSICPHMNTAFFGGLCTERGFLEGGLEFLRRSDAVVLVTGWEKSIGTLVEIEEAKKLGIPVYDGLENFMRRKELKWGK